MCLAPKYKCSAEAGAFLDALKQSSTDLGALLVDADAWI